MTPRKEEENQMIRDERREQILQAALRVFGHKGYAPAKISDIAATAGLSHGLVYHYFKSKDQIFAELVKIALEGSSGTFKTAFEAPGSPWERIRTMTEMIVPAAYEGIGPYYFNIMFEAMISDAVPQEVKDMVIKNAPYYEYLVPLIIEGQKEGQVAEDNPLQLATAYLSLIQGMAIMLLQTTDPASIPSPEIILRLLRRSDYQEPAREYNESNLGLFGPIELVPFPLKYSSRSTASGKPTILISSLELAVEEGINIYKIVETGVGGAQMIAKVRAEDWHPLAVESFGSNGKRLWQIVYEDNRVFFDIPERKLQKTMDLKGECYDVNTLFYLFRAFPFEKKKMVEFNLVMDGRGGGSAGIFKMYLQELGREEVAISGTTYDCFKLEMGVRGVPAVFAGKYKVYFWYTATEPRYLVKYEDKLGGLTELIENQ